MKGSDRNVKMRYIWHPENEVSYPGTIEEWRVIHRTIRRAGVQ